MKYRMVCVAAVCAALGFVPVLSGPAQASDPTQCHVLGDGHCENNGVFGHGVINACVNGLNGQVKYVELQAVFKGQILQQFDYPTQVGHMYVGDKHYYTYRVFNWARQMQAPRVNFHWRATVDTPFKWSWMTWLAAECKCPCAPSKTLVPHYLNLDGRID